MKYLASQTNALVITDPTYSIENITCSSEEITPLHQYCFRARISRLRSMTDIRNMALYDYATEYHRNDDPHVPATNIGRWLNTSSIPPSTRDTVYRDMVMAILQYIIDMDLIQL